MQYILPGYDINNVTKRKQRDLYEIEDKICKIISRISA